MVFGGANVEHADERLVRPSWGCHFAPRRRGRSSRPSDGQAHSCESICYVRGCLTWFTVPWSSAV